MPTQMLSEERIEDSSDGENDSTDLDQTPKETVKKSRRDSVSKLAAEAISREDNDSDAGSQASITSAASSTASAGKRKADDAVTTLAESTAKRVKATNTSTKRIESTNYVPPQGYSASNFAAREFASGTKGIFESLEGKQVWHICAPSSMSMSKLESLDLDGALKGQPILSRNGVQYVLRRNDLEGQNLLLPKGSIGEYSASTVLPSRSFQIHESAQKPDKGQVEAGSNGDGGSTLRFFATKTGTDKPPRKQPQTLNGHYVPYGVIRDEVQPDGDMTVDGAAHPEQPLQAAPRTPKKSSKKRTDDPGNEGSAVKSTKKSRSKTAEGSSSVTDSHKKKRKEKIASSSQ